MSRLASYLAVVAVLSIGCRIAGVPGATDSVPTSTVAPNPAVTLSSPTLPTPGRPTSGCGSAAVIGLGPEIAVPPPHGYPAQPHILSTGSAVTAAQVRDTGFELVDPSLHKAPLAAVIMVNSPNGDGSIYEVRQYFTEVEIGEITTLDDVIQSGGYMLTQRIAAGQDAELVMRESNRAVEVTVASYAGALIWGDPHREGARRAFGLYWSDGKYDLSIRAGLEDPADVVEIARSIYCST